MVEENQEDTISLKAKEENFARIKPLKKSGKSSLSGTYSLTIMKILIEVRLREEGEEVGKLM